MGLGNRNPVTRHTAGVISEEWWAFKPGDRVLVTEGFLGTVEAVEDGPHPGSESYQVILDGGMGGGDYASGELSGADSAPKVAKTAAVVTSEQHEADLDQHCASEDYPILTDILQERLPLEHAVAATGFLASKTAAQRLEKGTSEYKQDYNKGWAAGKGGSMDALERADGRGVSNAWYDGYGDYASGRPKWTTMRYELGAWESGGAPITGSKTASNFQVVDDQGQVVAGPFDNSFKAQDEASANPAHSVVAVPESQDTSFDDGWAAGGIESFDNVRAEAGWVQDKVDQFSENTGYQPGNNYSVDWCRFRRNEHCFYPRDLNAQATAQAGYEVWVPEDRGYCPRRSWEDQRVCPAPSQPGPKSNHPQSRPDATVAWEDGGQRRGSVVPVTITSQKQVDTPGELDWHFTAGWKDVQTKAKSIKDDGHVRILSATDGYVVGEIRGSANIYQARLMRAPGSQSVAMWECGCAWANYSWARSGRWKKYEGRMCSHALALNYEAQARGMFGKEVGVDLAAPKWRNDPTVPVILPGDARTKPGPWRVGYLRNDSYAPHQTALLLSDRKTNVRVSDCKKCGHAIAWVPSKKSGKNYPCEVRPANDMEYGTNQGSLRAYPWEPHRCQTDPELWRTSSLIVRLAEIDPSDPEAGMRKVLEECESSDHTHSGLVIKSVDSGRVLMTQRTPFAEDPEDVYGRWEFPGGGIEEGETAWESALREFSEETGLQLPTGSRVVDCYSNGPYLAIIVLVANESWSNQANLLDFEVMGVGWFDPDQIDGSDLARAEVDKTEWDIVREAVRKEALPRLKVNPTVEEVVDWYATVSKIEEPKVSLDIQQIANEQGGIMAGFRHRVKDPKSVADKIRLKGPSRLKAGVPPNEWISDPLRYTVTFHPANYGAGVRDTLYALEERNYDVVGNAENSWQKGDSYSGMHFGVHTPGGLLMELQFHTAESFILKQKTLHKMYEEFRKPATPLRRRQELWEKMTRYWDEVEIPKDVLAWPTKQYYYKPTSSLNPHPISTDPDLVIAPSASLRYEADIKAKVRGIIRKIKAIVGLDKVRLEDDTIVPVKEVQHPDFHPTRGISGFKARQASVGTGTADFEILVAQTGKELTHVGEGKQSNGRPLSLCGTTVDPLDTVWVNAMGAMAAATCDRCVTIVRQQRVGLDGWAKTAVVGSQVEAARSETYRGVKLKVKKGKEWGWLVTQVNGHGWLQEIGTDEEKVLVQLRRTVDAAIADPDGYDDHWQPGHKGVADPYAWQGHRCAGGSKVGAWSWPDTKEPASTEDLADFAVDKGLLGRAAADALVATTKGDKDLAKAAWFKLHQLVAPHMLDRFTPWSSDQDLADMDDRGRKFDERYPELVRAGSSTTQHSFLDEAEPSDHWDDAESHASDTPEGGEHNGPKVECPLCKTAAGGPGWWHGSPSGELRGAPYGLHIGTYQSAKEALEARIGRRADGKDWDGTQEYGKTLLASAGAGYGVGRDGTDYSKPHFPRGGPALTYSDGTAISLMAKPDLFRVQIVGEMSNTPQTPHEDFKANGYMRAQTTRGTAKRGYYYVNISEDEGSISAVVPNGGSHLRRMGSKTAAVRDTPSEQFGLRYDSSLEHHPEVLAAKDFDGWGSVPIVSVDAGSLYATEAMLSSAPINKVVHGGEPLRSGYDAFVLKLSDGREALIDGHHRAAMAAMQGRPLKAHVLDASSLPTVGASTFDTTSPFGSGDGWTRFKPICEDDPVGFHDPLAEPEYLQETNEVPEPVLPWSHGPTFASMDDHFLFEGSVEDDAVAMLTEGYEAGLVEADALSWFAPNDAGQSVALERVGTLHDEPEPALPTTDAEAPLEDEEAEGSVTAPDWLSPGGDSGSGRYQSSLAANTEIAAMAAQFLKVGAKAFSVAEQQVIINEGAGVAVASNLDRLDITGTHYEALAERDTDDGWLF